MLDSSRLTTVEVTGSGLLLIAVAAVTYILTGSKASNCVREPLFKLVPLRHKVSNGQGQKGQAGTQNHNANNEVNVRIISESKIRTSVPKPIARLVKYVETKKVATDKDAVYSNRGFIFPSCSSIGSSTPASPSIRSHNSVEELDSLSLHDMSVLSTASALSVVESDQSIYSLSDSSLQLNASVSIVAKATATKTAAHGELVPHIRRCHKLNAELKAYLQAKTET